MKFIQFFLCSFLIISFTVNGQSPSFSTYMNPVIPGDHPDPTLTKVGNDFYSTGSSFNPTPKILHSTDLVHWEVISQPVSPSWSAYGDAAGGGIWGGHMVYYNDFYWDFFGRNGTMYVIKASDPKGPWSSPSPLAAPAGVPGLGQDNSIFIDDNNRWYLLTKNGQSVNYIIELGSDGKPRGDVINLSWLNPSPAYPYSWAEGPVMWKANGQYYYCFARNLAGGQYVMRSENLSSDSTEWSVPENFFESVSNSGSIQFRDPNHCSPAITLDDGSSWIISFAYSKGNSAEWMGQGRQGILSRVNYDEGGKPLAEYPSNNQVQAPKLPSSGIPWLVPHSDMFSSAELDPEWSFLGATPSSTYSLTDRPGWFRLSPKNKPNTIIKPDAEHNYTLITRVSFTPETIVDEAGIQIFNGLQTLYAKLFLTMDDSARNIVRFSYTGGQSFDAVNTFGDTVWLKLNRTNHVLSGFFSADGRTWEQVGSVINVSNMDKEQSNFNQFTGNQQGLYVNGKEAYFDLYIYRDAYSQILAQPAANQYGTLRPGGGVAPAYLDSINNNDWAMYAGVEFGGTDYNKTPLAMEIRASSASSGGTVEVWLDSIDTGRKIAVCPVNATSGWSDFQLFTADVDTVSGLHDVYLKFTGAGSGNLFKIHWFRFLSEYDLPNSVEDKSGQKTGLYKFQLNQNYPNPFNPSTKISFYVPYESNVSLVVYDMLGKEVDRIMSEQLPAGEYSREWNAENFTSGIYFCRLKAGNFIQTKKMMLLR